MKIDVQRVPRAPLGPARVVPPYDRNRQRYENIDKQEHTVAHAHGVNTSLGNGLRMPPSLGYEQSTAVNTRI